MVKGSCTSMGFKPTTFCLVVHTMHLILSSFFLHCRYSSKPHKAVEVKDSSALIGHVETTTRVRKHTAPALKRQSTRFVQSQQARCYIKLCTCLRSPAKQSLLWRQSQETYLFQLKIKPCPRREIPIQCHLLKMHFSQGAMCLSVTHSCRALELEDNTRGGEGAGKKAEKLNIKVSLFPNTRSHLFCGPQRKK